MSTNKITERGLLLIACGNYNYGRMAAVLAASLKAAAPDIPIHLAYTDSAVARLNEGELALFDTKALIPAKYYTHKGRIEYIRTKVYMYNLSPFKETIFLDCDMIWLKKSPVELFEQLKDVELTFSNGGYHEQSQWADVAEIKAAYGIDKIYDLHSEFMYFQKGDTAKTFFKEAQGIYNNLKVKATVFAGAIPDELPFLIAAATTNTAPHQMPFLPIYWQKRQKQFMFPYQKAKQWFAISMGGNTNTPAEVTDYNNLALAAYLKMGLQYPYQWKHKSSFLAERKQY